MARDTGQGEDSTHYLIGEEKYPSVTSIIKTVMNGSFGPASWWGFRLGVEWAAEAIPGVDFDAWYAAAKKSPFNPNSTRDKAGSRGRASHSLLEGLIKGTIHPVKGYIDGLPLLGYELAVYNWWKNMEGKVLGCEEKVWSERHGYAGTLDLVRLVDGEVEMDDLKTHKGSPRFEDLLQVAAYGEAWAEMHGGLPPNQLVIVAHEDGTFEESDAWVNPDVFLNVLAIYKEMEAMA